MMNASGGLTFTLDILSDSPIHCRAKLYKGWSATVCHESKGEAVDFFTLAVVDTDGMRFIPTISET
jgi:hypothetical protein